jgi:hypothetical protein
MDEVIEVLAKKLLEWKERLTKQEDWDRADCWVYEQTLRILRQEKHDEPDKY